MGEEPWYGCGAGVDVGAGDVRFCRCFADTACVQEAAGHFFVLCFFVVKSFVCVLSFETSSAAVVE